MSILYEIRRQVTRGGRAILLVPKQDLHNYTGFRSIYGFGSDAQEYILTEQTTAGLAGHNFYSDELLVDFDDEWDAAEELAEDLMPYSYQMYDTGGRSIHFHIPITPMYGADTPAIQREWMKLYYPRSDTGIYKSSGIYRLPDTYHHKKIGAKKVLIEDNQGDTLEIGDVRPKTVWHTALSPEEEREDIERALDNLLMMSIREGGRNTRAFNIMRLCKLTGETYDSTLRLLNLWNEQFCHPPLGTQELRATLHSVFTRSDRRA